jgi:hypothetical protein
MVCLVMRGAGRIRGAEMGEFENPTVLPGLPGVLLHENVRCVDVEYLQQKPFLRFL